LGTMSDQEVSRTLGRGICGVKRRRMILHIDPGPTKKMIC
jgi:hypothetical protein